MAKKGNISSGNKSYTIAAIKSKPELVVSLLYSQITEDPANSKGCLITQNPEKEISDPTFCLVRESEGTFSLDKVSASDLISSINELHGVIKKVIAGLQEQLDEETDISPSTTYHGVQILLAELAQQKHSSIAA